MVKRRTGPNKSFEPTQDAAAKTGRRGGRRRSPKRDEGGGTPADRRHGERLIPDGTTLDLELREEVGGYAPSYKVRVERLFRQSALSLTQVTGRRGRR